MTAGIAFPLSPDPSPRWGEGGDLFIAAEGGGGWFLSAPTPLPRPLSPMGRGGDLFIAAEGGAADGFPLARLRETGAGNFPPLPLAGEGSGERVNIFNRRGTNRKTVEK
jgi:hypothetical protein